MKIAISGAGGFVGGKILEFLARKGHATTALYFHAKPNFPGLAVPPSIVACDVRQEFSLSHDLDAVVHCAALLPSAGSDESQFVSTNVNGMRNVLAAASSAEIKRVIYLSSLSVFGEAQGQFLSESTPVQPHNPYGRSKYAAEVLLAEWVTQNPERSGISLRLPGVVGKGSHHNFPSDILATALGGKTQVIYNPEHPYNHVLHVNELSDYVHTLLMRKDSGYEQLLVASEEPLPIREAAEVIFAECGAPLNIVIKEGMTATPPVKLERAKKFGFVPATVRETLSRFAREAVASEELTP